MITEVVARSVVDLEHVLARLARLGKLSTSVAFSWKEKRGSPIERLPRKEEKVY